MVCLVNEAVKYTLCQDGGGEEGIPVLRRAVRGYDQRAAAATLINKFIDIFSLLLREFFHGEIVEKEHIGFEVAPQPAVPGTVGMATAEVGQQARGSGIQYLIAHPTCLMALALIK